MLHLNVFFAFQTCIPKRIIPWILACSYRAAKCFVSTVLCSRMPGLTQTQRQICTESSDAVVSLASGQWIGASECQKQFHGKMVGNYRPVYCMLCTHIIYSLIFYERSSLELYSRMEYWYVRADSSDRYLENYVFENI